MDPDATALYAPSMAQIGLSAASVPPNCWNQEEHKGALRFFTVANRDKICAICQSQF